jgi:ABC-type transport system involved in cytochrome c biogenesis permease subunit
MKNNMSIEKSKKIVYLYDMYNAYVSGQQLKFDKTVKVFKEIVKYENMSIDEGKINLEIFYNSLDPFYKSKFFFGFSIIFLLLSFMFFKTFFYRVSFLLLLTGFFMTLSGTVLRMYIRARPPVTNLYETFIFTALITALLGLILELFRKKNIGIFTGGFSGFVMLMIASKYALDGDTMGMLVAVLDSNFWLAFHVITIILGYSGIILSGVIGHIYLIIDVFNSKNKSLLDDIFSAVYSIQAFGLVFTFLGTVLGGIWADQSWGRFWGWDPKENGALLVLLWSVILFHAKIAKMIKRKGFVFGTIIGVIFVSLAWFGVNLLGVGLHTYGFTSGVARGLFSFVGFELFFILLIGSFSKFGNIRNSNSNVKNSKK